MKIYIYKNATTTSNPHGVDARKIYQNEHTQVVHIHLKPNEHLIKHTAAVDMFFYVLEGEGSIEIGDEKKMVTQDMLVESPKNIAHCLYNNGTSDFRVLVVKTPAPTIEQNRKAISEMMK